MIPRRLKLLVALLVLVAGAACWRLLAAPSRGPGWEAYRAALRASAAGRPDEAAGMLRQAVVAEPGNGEHYAELGAVYLEQREYERAAAALQTAAFLAPERPHLYCQLSQALVELRRRDEALAALEIALKKSPDCPHALTVQGEQLLRDDNLKAALPAFQRVAQLQPDFGLAYQRMGYILLETNQVAQAQEALEKGLRVTPGHPGMHFLLGECFRRQPSRPGSGQRAEQHFRAALVNNPEAAAAHVALGRLHLGRRELAAAREQYQRALALSPGSQDALYGLAQAARREGRAPEADRYQKRFEAVQALQRQIGELQAQAQAGTGDVSLQLRVARLCLEHGLLEDAERTLDLAVQAAPGDRQARELRARLYQRLGEPERASREVAVAARLPREGRG